MTSSKLFYITEAYFQIPSQWELQLQHMGFGGYKHLVHSKYLLLFLYGYKMKDLWRFLLVLEFSPILLVFFHHYLFVCLSFYFKNKMFTSGGHGYCFPFCLACFKFWPCFLPTKRVSLLSVSLYGFLCLVRQVATFFFKVLSTPAHSFSPHSFTIRICESKKCEEINMLSFYHHQWKTGKNLL